MSRHYRVEGKSMEPGFPEGNRVGMVRRAYRHEGPQRGDIVVLRVPGAHRLDLKRVVGLPGEEITWGRGQVSINGRPLEEPYARQPSAPPGDDEARTWRLGPGEYLVMGDNRLYSTDSRHYGPIQRRRIIGKATGD